MTETLKQNLSCSPYNHNGTHLSFKKWIQHTAMAHTEDHGIGRHSIGSLLLERTDLCKYNIYVCICFLGLVGLGIWLVQLHGSLTVLFDYSKAPTEGNGHNVQGIQGETIVLIF